MEIAYTDTANDIAKSLAVTSKTVLQWAREGYPVRQKDGSIEKVRLPGAVMLGVKKWGFNKRVVLNFIENIRDEKWASIEENIKQQTERQKQPRIGLISMKSTESHTMERLKDLVALQKGKQRNYMKLARH